MSPDLEDIATSSSVDEIASQLNPKKIVSSAEMWDSRDFAAWASDRGGIDFVKVDSGAIVLNKEKMKAMKATNAT